MRYQGRWCMGNHRCWLKYSRLWLRHDSGVGHYSWLVHYRSLGEKSTLRLRVQDRLRLCLVQNCWPKLRWSLKGLCLNVGCDGCLLYRHVRLHLYLNGLNRGFVANWTHSHLLDCLLHCLGGQTLADWLHCVPCHLQCCPSSLCVACCPCPEKGLALRGTSVAYSPYDSILCDPSANP